MTVLVTGAAGHIGSAIAAAMADRTTGVAVSDVDDDALGELVGRLPGAAGVAADVGHPDAAARLVNDVADQIGPIDVLINVAGIEGPIGPVEALDPAEVERVFRVNVLSMFWLCGAVVPDMKRRRRGRIVNLASGAGLAGGALASAYHASKHAVVGLTRSLARELGPSGIAVNAVCPGYVDSPMVERIFDGEASASGHRPDPRPGIPMGRLAEAGEVAAAVAYLALDAPIYQTGSCVVLDGGLRA